MKNSNLIHTTELPKILGVSGRTICRWINDGKLNAIIFSPYYKYITEEELKRILTPVYYHQIKDEKEDIQ